MTDQADFDDTVAFEHEPPIMLPSNAPETILLLLVVSLGLTVILHNASITHIVGILVLVFIAKINALIFNSYAMTLLSKIACLNALQCQEKMKAYLSNLGGEVLSGFSGVSPDHTVFDNSGALNEEFLRRAGVIGSIMTLFLIYKPLFALYSKAYSVARETSQVAELRCEQLVERTNPLKHLGDNHSEASAITHANPLKSPNDHCTMCEAMEATQEEWVDAVRQYGEASVTIVEENNALTEQIKTLQQEVAGLREEARISQDRVAYLDVLLEEAGKQLECDADVKNMLWDAYSRRQEIGSLDESSEEASDMLGSPEDVELPSSPPPYRPEDALKSIEAIVAESLMD